MRNQQAHSWSKVYLVMLCSAIVVAAVLLAAIPASAQNTDIKLVPIAYTDPASGQQMYTTYCATCHGMTGQGNGPAAPALKNAPTNLAKLSSSHNGKFPNKLVQQSIVEGGYVPAHGSARMPVWGDLFSRLDGFSSRVPEIRVKALTDYIESLQTK